MKGVNDLDVLVGESGTKYNSVFKYIRTINYIYYIPLGIQEVKNT
jgi:hypothetical protein